mgnify:CR=1 FL=1
MLKLAAIGDCCVDTYPQLNKFFLGGTSYNLCLAAQKLGAETSLISIIGTDEWGKKYLDSCHRYKINTDYLSIKNGKTSTVQIDLDQQNRPIFHDWQLGVLKPFTLTQKQLNFISTQDVVRCICLKPLIKVFKQFCHLKTKAFKVADFSGGTKYSPSLTIINQSVPYLDLIVTSQSYQNKKILAHLQNLARKFDKLVLVLLGSRGSRVFTKDKTYLQPAVTTKATDTTGAGDAYLATFIIKYLQTKNVQKAMFFATQAAAKKIARLGASS